MGVLGEEERLEAALLNGPSKLRGTNRVVGRNIVTPSFMDSLPVYLNVMRAGDRVTVASND
jgi:hypothetical protein